MDKQSAGLGSWVALATLVVLAVLLLYLLFSNLLIGKAQWLRILLSAFIMGVAVWAAWMTRPNELADGSFFERGGFAKRVAFLSLALLGAAALVTGIVPSLDPIPASAEKSPGERQAVPEGGRRGERSKVIQPVLTRIVGVWGESDCAVSFRFRVKDRALLIESVRTPAGRAPYHAVATIIDASGDRIETRDEEFRGAVFSYWTNGVVEQLTWDDGRDTPPSKLRRCSEQL